jgi:hypothetical protein
VTGSALRQIAYIPSFLLVIAGLSSCASTPRISAAPNNQRQVGWGTARQEIHNVSVVELLGRPSEFDGQPVRVIGVASFDFGTEGRSAVYATTDDERHVTNSFVRIESLSPSLTAPLPGLEKLTGQFVVIEGIFRAKPLQRIPQVPGRELVCAADCRTSGTLEEVNRVSVWEF